ncbi:MAG: hypothetical protein D6767_10725 [Candidatus Hydrogenedentota bacterium]|nr:MAG: hypothetical protein D6767_10725 [Candidatus Hydrogenedentota bacterium]
MDDRAILILAAGYGKRMQEYTANTPKPLLPIQQKPMLYYLLDEISDADYTGNVYINLHYLPKKMEAALQSYRKQINPAFKIKTLYEKKMYGAGGTLFRLCKEKREIKKVMLFSADALYTNFCKEIQKAWQWKGDADAYLALKKKEKRHTSAPGFSFLHEVTKKEYSPIQYIRGGNYYYAGFSFFHADSVRQLPQPKKEYDCDLIEILKPLKLAGKITTNIISVGTKQEYENLLKKESLL